MREKQRNPLDPTRRALRPATMTLTACLLLGLLGACGPRVGTLRSEPPAVLEVDNGSGLDMNIYVVQTSGARNRVGTSTAHTRMWFRIPDRLIFGATPLRFQADPIGGSRLPVTQEITVVPGDTVVWRIPPY